MAESSLIASSDADIKKILEKLTEQITNNVNGLHLLREEVAAVEQLQRSEERRLHDLQKERAKIVSEEKRVRTNEDISFNQYQMQLKELEEDMNKHREATINSEVNEKVLAVLRDLVTKKNNELLVLRQNKQWTPNRTRMCAPASINSAIANQINKDLEQVSKKVQESGKDLQRLQLKSTEANKIVNRLRAYMETEKNAKLDMQCRIKVLRVERTQQNEASLVASQQVRPIRLELASSNKKSENRSLIIKELEEEKIRAGRLTKEIYEVVQQATQLAAEREEWLNRQFP